MVFVAPRSDFDNSIVQRGKKCCLPQFPAPKMNVTDSKGNFWKNVEINFPDMAEYKIHAEQLNIELNLKI